MNIVGPQLNFGFYPLSIIQHGQCISGGTIPDVKEVLKISSGFDRTFFKSLRISTDMLKGPVDLANFTISSSNSLEVVEKTKKLG